MTTQPNPQHPSHASNDSPMIPAPAARANRPWLDQPWAREILPFITSIAVHLAIIAIGVIFFLGVTYTQKPPAHQEQFIVPVSQLQTGNLAAAYPGANNDPTREAFQDRYKDGGTPDGWATEKGSRFNLRAPGGSANDAADPVIGAGPGGGFGIGKTGRGAGIGNDLGTGDSAGGPLRMFGTPNSGGGGGGGAIFAPPIGAKRIAFVCDASGSMVSKFSTLRRELSKSIHQLNPTQSFNVIFFEDTAALSMGTQLSIATPAMKLQADRYLETITPRASTNPLPALSQAFAQKPELIYFLTDGDFPDNPAVLAHIRALNKTAHVKINTIAFVSDADTETAFIDILKQIAEESAGTFRHVRDSDL